MAGRHYGAIESVPEGTTFVNRAALAAAGVHRPLQAGISGGKDGADSIVVSGGYVDDLDEGDTILYTGQGGNDSSSRHQIADQHLERGNAGLAVSCDEGLPVRVVRGAQGDPSYSPSTGYRYDGLYRVASYQPKVGRDGHRIWQFQLVKMNSIAGTDATATGSPAPRIETTVQRIVRSSLIARQVKDFHAHTCQVCGVQISTIGGVYAEGAHIRPLGRPHNGPDEPGNILCLCPNHHVMLDGLSIYVDEDRRVIETVTGNSLGRLRVKAHHQISTDQLTYQRDLCRKTLPL